MPMVQHGLPKTKYVECGSGEPLIFIHGVGMDHTMWEAQKSYFSSCYRVIAYDMMCHGESAKPSESVELADFAMQLKELMEYLEITDAHIVGFSMGGLVAQQFGLSFPQKVRTLSFMNAVASRNESEQDAILKRVKQVKERGHQVTIDKAINRWFTPDFIQANPNIINDVKDRLVQNDHSAYLKAYEIFATADQNLWPELDKITKPVLILTGEDDMGSTPEMARKMHKKIPQSSIHIIPNSRHMLPIEGSYIVNKILLDFFKKNK